MTPATVSALVDRFPNSIADRLRLYKCRWERRRPRTFNEKLRYKMVWDRRAILVTYADKVAAADYVARRIGAEYTPERYLVTEDLALVDPSCLPANYVVKNSHLSGGVVVVFDGADPEAELQAPDDVYARSAVRPESVSWDRLVAVSDVWRATTFVNATRPCGEWMYGRVPRRVIIEEVLLGPDGGLPAELRFYVFNGVCGMVRAVSNVIGGVKAMDDYWPDWSPIDREYWVGRVIPRSPSPPQRPRQLDVMIALAEELASETDFLRVDMFHLADRIVVGELTNFPDAANSRWDPPEVDMQLGELWELPRRYRAPR